MRLRDNRPYEDFQSFEFPVSSVLIWRSFDALKGREKKEKKRGEKKVEEEKRRKKIEIPRSTARIERQYLAAPPTRDRKGLSADGHW